MPPPTLNYEEPHKVYQDSSVLCRSTRRRTYRQKAPSAKRCIKTQSEILRGPHRVYGQKAPSAIRCIKTEYLDAGRS